MGMRPFMQFVCGIDDLKWEGEDRISDPRFKGDNNYYHFCEFVEELDDFLNDYPEDYFHGQYHRMEKEAGWDMLAGKSIHELLYFNNPYDSGSDHGIIGLNLEHLYNNDCLWVLTAMDERFKEGGHFNMPSSDPVPFSPVSFGCGYLEYRRYLADKASGKNMSIAELREIASKTSVIRKRIRNNWNYPYFDGYMSFYSEATCYLLKTIGLHVRKRDLKLMLVWGWS